MIRFLFYLVILPLTLYLQLSGKLSHYINLHYSYLVYISMVLSLLLALVQFYIWIKKINSHSHLESRRSRRISILYCHYLCFIGVAFPTVSLDSRTVSAKGYHFPLAEESTQPFRQAKEHPVNTSNPIPVPIFPSLLYEKEMRSTADKYITQPTIQVTDENYMEVMEVLYDYPQSLKESKSSLQALSITILAIR